MNVMVRLTTVVTLLALGPAARAYSVLTHEAIIDSTWDQTIRPRLLARFPATTPDQLNVAHGYAYGGSIIQDMGYYPFGNRFFTDLVHYARSGDFVVNLLREARDVNEYAFAMGALAHYAADNVGHPIAVNRVVPMMYPKDRVKYGNEVTYEDDPKAHIRTEFGFDVVEVAKGRYASQAYHDFIGFKVSKPVLERAFAGTYGLQLTDIFPNLDLALGSYRRTVGTIIPEMTKAAWAAKKNDIQASQPGITRHQFIYRLSRSSYEKEWGHQSEKPGFGAQLLALVFHIVPKVGPFKALAFKVPTPEAESLFMDSFDKSVDRFKESVERTSPRALHLANQNFDLGKPTRAGEYRMADETYAKLLERLADRGGPVPADLRANILAFYSGSPVEASGKARQELMALRH
jgi:hypothetical protein